MKRLQRAFRKRKKARDLERRKAEARRAKEGAKAEADRARRLERLARKGFERALELRLEKIVQQAVDYLEK